MLDLMIERWSNRDGSEEVLWSLWRDGSRTQMGGPCRDAETAEAEGRSWCQQALGQEPDRVTRL